MSTMKVFALVFLSGSLHGEAACPCMATPAEPNQTAAVGAPAYVGETPAYGWGCMAHDQDQGDCATSNETGKGQADDWCLDKWCIVDPANCDHKTRLMAYTADPNDYFSYEACDASFTGNAWVGRCKNCDAPHVNSFCTCGGLPGCKCLAGSTKQTSAVNKPKFVGEVPAFGWGCKAHDQGQDMCATSNKTGKGQADDWCLDKWCIVDPATCDQKTRKMAYTGEPNDYFSYDTCDASFTGNGWVGRCKNCDAPHVNSFCTCGGLPGCKCKAGSTKQTSAVGKPKFVGEVPAFGWGCKAHDQGQDMCATSNKTGKDQADDWCLDKWCIVDPATCDQKTRKMAYTAEPNDYFSYEACDANFTGNGWVGRCKNCDAPHVNSFCTCGGLSGCECLPGSTKQKILPGKPAYAGEVPAYGWGCKAHDKGYGSCANSTKTATGQADDWCLDKWCLVNPTTCKFKTTKSGYTVDPDDAFSYETCDANFTGNSCLAALM